MKRILYGKLPSEYTEHMIINETEVSEEVISALYHSVTEYCFGYMVCGHTSIWYHVNRYSQNKAEYISCVCKDFEECEDILSPLEMFDYSFHTETDVSQNLKSGTYRLRQYRISYPPTEHIAKMYKGLLDILRYNGRLIIIMSSEKEKEFFLSSALHLLARFFYVLPIKMRNYISFSVGGNNIGNGLHICVVSEPVMLLDHDVTVDLTVPPKESILNETLVGYWTGFFDSDDNSDEEMEELFDKCINVRHHLSAVPWLYLYDLVKRPDPENYQRLCLHCYDCLMMDELQRHIDIDEIIANEKKQAEQKKKQEVFLKAVSVMDDYVGSMEQRWKKRIEENYSYDRFEERQEYGKYMEFFAAVTQLAQEKVGQYPDQAEEKSVKLWKTLRWNNCFDEDYVTNIFGESIAFDLPYEHITDMEPLNPYTGLFLYLQAIKEVNTIDLYQKSRSEENGIILDHSYNHSCYDRNVSGLVYYGLRSNVSYSTFCYYKDFLDMTSLVCLYVFVNDMADPGNKVIEGYRKPENLNQEKIKQLMNNMFMRIGKSKYIVFYHCVFLYGAMMGFFRNIGKSLSPKELDYALAEKFDVIDSIDWLLQQFGGKSMQNIIYENTLNSFAQKGKCIINFGIKKKMDLLKSMIKEPNHNRKRKMW